MRTPPPQSFTPSDEQYSQPHSKPVFVSKITPADHPSTPLMSSNATSNAEKPPDVDGRPLRRQQTLRYSQILWLWELLSLLLAAVALGATLLTLKLFDKKEIPKWPASLNLSTLIAIFSAVFKAALMMPIGEAISQLKWLWYRNKRPLRDFEDFDRASRGPWGSLVLLGSLRWRTMAFVGALLTLIALAIDPFAQQLFHFYTCPIIIQSSLSSIPRSGNYSDLIGIGRNVRITHDMRSAMFLGLLGPKQNMSTLLSIDCSSGNCTYPSTDGAAYQSLALNTSCADISGQIRQTNLTKITRSNTTFQEPVHILPSNLSLSDVSGFVFNSTSVGLIIDADPADGSTSTFDRPYLIKFQALAQTSDFFVSKYNPVAFECSIYPVINTYNGSIINGRLQEHVIDSKALDVFNLGGGSFASLLLHTTLRNGSWESCTTSDTPDTNHTLPLRFVDDDLSGPLPPVLSDVSLSSDTSGATWYQRDCFYELRVGASAALSIALDNFFGNETLFFDGLNQDAQGNQWTANLWNNGTISLDSLQGKLTGLTDAMTALIRNGGSGDNLGSEPAFGTVQVASTCARVRWGWIALPAAVFALTASFLCGTILQALWYGDNAVWKSSAVAVLFHGLSSETRAVYGALPQIDEINAAAGELEVRLVEDKNGHRSLII